MDNRRLPASDALAFDVYTAHCFLFGTCQHVERACSPQEVHDQMERHYEAKHRAQINALIDSATVRPKGTK